MTQREPEARLEDCPRWFLVALSRWWRERHDQRWGELTVRFEAGKPHSIRVSHTALLTDD